MKRLLSFILSMGIVLGTLPISISANATGSEPVSTPLFTEGFEEQSVGALTSSDAFSAIDDASDHQIVEFTVAEDGDGNMVLHAKHDGRACVGRVSNFAEFKDDTKYTTAGNYKLVEYDFDNDGETSDEEYYIAQNGTGNTLYWVKKSSVSAGALPSKPNNTDYGQWFVNVGGRIGNVLTKDGGSSSVTPMKPTADGVKTLTYSFDYKYVAEDGTPFEGDEGICIRMYNGAGNTDALRNEIYLRGDYIKINGSVKIYDGENFVTASRRPNNMVPKTDGVDTFITSADADEKLEAIDVSAVNGGWANIKIVFDLDAQTYTLYYNDKAVYFDVAEPKENEEDEQKYSWGCVMQIPSGTEGSMPAGVSFNCQRWGGYYDRELYLDNFTASYTAPEQTGWDGTTETAVTADASGVYNIGTPEELAWARTKINAGEINTASFKLTADIDLNNKAWIPMGTESVPFNGTFDGGKFEISNMYIDAIIDTTTRVSDNGFFGYTGTNAVVKNLGIVDSKVQAMTSRSASPRPRNIAVMVGYAAGTWTNCYVADSTAQNQLTDAAEGTGTAGFAAYVINAKISNCYVRNIGLRSGQVKPMGGFFAATHDTAKSTLTNCYTAGVYIYRDGTSHSGATNDAAMFAFGSSKNGDIDFSTCYSDSTNTSSGYTGANHITDEAITAQTKGNIAMAKSDLVTAMVATGAYAEDTENVNDGYPVFAEAMPWDGTKETAVTADASGVYNIGTPEELAWARTKINAGEINTASFKLTADIDLNGKTWIPIGFDVPFSGVFDGNKFVVSNALVTPPSGFAEGGTYNNLGFFSRTENAEIKNLGLDGIKVLNPKNNGTRAGGLGGLVGKISGTTTISNSFVRNTTVIQANNGRSEVGTGAFLGTSDSASAVVKNCYTYNVGVRSAQQNAQGGFFGAITVATSFTNCYSAECYNEDTGWTTHSPQYGFGKSNKVQLTNCYSTMESGVFGKGYTGTGGDKYDDTMNCGIVSTTESPVTAATIEAALVTAAADCAWAKDTATTNGGYPILTYAEDTNPDPTPTATATAKPTPTATATAKPTATATAKPTTTPTTTTTPSTGEWDGTTETAITPVAGVYNISTASELAWARTQINAGKLNTAIFKLTADIDLNNKIWVPIGKFSKPFNGTFDGNKHVVRNIKVDGKIDASNLITDNGFFGYTGSSSSVKNLGIDNIHLAVKNANGNNNAEGSKDRGRINTLGGMVGHAGGEWDSCYVINSKIQNTQTDTKEGYGSGGFAGYADNGVSITNCYVRNIGLRSGQLAPMAGFVASANSGENIIVENCYVADIYIYRDGTSHNKETNDSAFYAFASTGNAKLDWSKCYSNATTQYSKFTTDAASITDTTVDKNKKGNEGVDKAAIEAALVTTDTYCPWVKDTANANDGYPVLSYKVKPDPDRDACKADADALDELGISRATLSGFTVPTAGANGSTIRWSSSNTDAMIVSLEGVVTVIPSEAGAVDVKLTAIVEKGKYQEGREYTITVKQLVISNVRADLADIVTADNGDGTTKHSLAISYDDLDAKGYTELIFKVVKTDANGDITKRGEDKVAVESGKGVTASFVVDLENAKAGENVNYYLWADDRVSLLDNGPSDLANYTARPVVTGVMLSWDASVDDSGNPITYKIYRGTDLVEETYATSYKAEGSVSEGSDYKVIPVDSSGAPGAEGIATNIKQKQWEFANGGGSNFGIDRRENSGGDAYSEEKFTYKDPNGVDHLVFTSDGTNGYSTKGEHYIYFLRTADTEIENTDSDLVFEIDYVDNTKGVLTFQYNGILPAGETENGTYARKRINFVTRENTGLIKTAVIRVTNAQLRESGNTSGSSFGIVIPGSDEHKTIMIKEIRVTKYEDYGKEVEPSA